MVARLGEAAWEMGKLGAQSLDTKAAFKSMMESVGQSPQLLQQMKAAAGGTVSELKLMQGVNLALAGTTGTLAAAMAEAQPKMLEIARAAYKMNPALGSVEFLYQSLNTGIKRNQKLLVDNLGIVVNQTQAQERYAKSIGLTARELTEEQKQLAFLNDVIGESGQTLIEQVGGVEALGDAFAKLDTSIADMKAGLGEMVAPVVLGILKEINAELAILDERRKGNLGVADAMDESADAAHKLESSIRGIAEMEAKLKEATLKRIAAESSASDVAEGYWKILEGFYQDRLDYWVKLKRAAEEELGIANDLVEAEKRHAKALKEVAGLTGVGGGGLWDTSKSALATGAAATDAATALLWLTIREEALAKMSATAAEKQKQLTTAIYATERAARALAQQGYEISPILSKTGLHSIVMRDLRDLENQIEEVEGNIASVHKDYLADRDEDAARSTVERMMLQVDSERDAAAEVIDIWEKAHQKRKGILAGILEPTQSFDKTQLLDQMGLHEDTWDEVARQAMTGITEGFGSEWIGKNALIDMAWDPDLTTFKGNLVKAIDAFYAFEFAELINTDAIAKAYADIQSRAINKELFISDLLANDPRFQDEATLRQAMGVYDPIQGKIDDARDSLDAKYADIQNLGTTFMDTFMEGVETSTGAKKIIDAFVEAVLAAIAELNP